MATNWNDFLKKHFCGFLHDNPHIACCNADIILMSQLFAEHKARLDFFLFLDIFAKQTPFCPYLTQFFSDCL